MISEKVSYSIEGCKNEGYKIYNSSRNEWIFKYIDKFFLIEYYGFLKQSYKTWHKNGSIIQILFDSKPVYDEK